MSLIEQFQDAEKRARVVDACVLLVNSEVDKKKGFGGIVIKAGYGAVKSIKPGFVRKVVDGLFDRWAAELDGTHDFIGDHVHHTLHPFLPRVYVSPIPSIRSLRALNSHKPAYTPMPSRPSGSHQGVHDDCEDFMSQLVQ